MVFVSDMYGGPNIFAETMATGEIKRLSYFGNNNTAPAFSPKGDLIAFVSKTEGALEICVMRPDGSDARVLTDGGVNDSPHFSPCGRYILYSSQKGDSKTQVYFMLRNGDNKRALASPAVKRPSRISCPRRGRIMKKLLPLCAAVALLLFYGCASTPASVPLSERAAQEAGQRKQQGLTSESQKGKEGAVTEEDLAKADEERRRRAAAEEAMKAGHFTDIYFEFDSYNVRPDDIPILKDLAAWLSANQAAKLTVEGYCDERGTVEYNLALGQKRADAAKDYLVKLGVSDKRIRAVSYGKEAPLVSGHTEDAWAKNRRAHFVVQ